MSGSGLDWGHRAASKVVKELCASRNRHRHGPRPLAVLQTRLLPRTVVRVDAS